MKNEAKVFIGVLAVLSFFFSQIQGQTGQVKALGKYDFYHYYTYGELQNFLEDMHAAYPRMTELKSLCKSLMMNKLSSNRFIN